MDLFVSTFTNRLDAKGRVSVPASFRAVLSRDGFEGLYVHPSLHAPALDAGGNLLLSEIESVLADHPRLSEERERLAMALFGSSEILKIDGEGRVALPEAIAVGAGLSDRVSFVGLGSKFQIWEPEQLRAYLEEARARVRTLKRSFDAPSAQPPGARVP